MADGSIMSKDYHEVATGLTRLMSDGLNLRAEIDRAEVRLVECEGELRVARVRLRMARRASEDHRLVTKPLAESMLERLQRSPVFDAIDDGIKRGLAEERARVDRLRKRPFASRGEK